MCRLRRTVLMEACRRECETGHRRFIRANACQGVHRAGKCPAASRQSGGVSRRGDVHDHRHLRRDELLFDAQFDGKKTTVHWGYAQQFKNTFPNVPLLPEQVLVVSGERQQLVASGASMTWHDLVLYLIARHVGATAAQTVARFFALQWHHGGLAPYIVFSGRTDHGDAQVADAQGWLATQFSVANPVEEMIRRSNIPERTFKRRFKAATGLAPLDYVQRLRVEDAKRRLERTDAALDDISWKVGYEDAAFFRRLFKRTTGLSPGEYRRKFRIPSFAQTPRAREKA
jgi:transcriptional regulator GlxA family with amidase domain